jgi:hypothetical protein
MGTFRDWVEAVHATESPASATAPVPHVRRPADMRRRIAERAHRAGAAAPNRTGIPDQLKSAVEAMSGFSFDDVRVNHSSVAPSQVGALAYTQGRDIEIAPGEERHLAHEAWHVVQQAQGRVRPTARSHGAAVNEDPRLEQEADRMAARATRYRSAGGTTGSTGLERPRLASMSVRQLVKGLTERTKVVVKVVGDENLEPDEYPAEITAAGPGDTYTVKFDDADVDGLATTKVYPESVVRPARAAVVVEKPAAKRIAPPWKLDKLEFDEQMDKDVARVVGEDATTIDDLSEQQLDDLIALVTTRITSPNFFVKNLVKSLVFSLEDLRKHNETPEQAEQRRLLVTADIEMSEAEAFQARFGVKLSEATWERIAVEVPAWFQAVKAAERTLGFEAAFRANRMTARQINIGDTARGGRFQAQKLGSKPEPATDRQMLLDNTIAGVTKRTNPASFADRATRNREGVHDMSASLLRGDKGIYEQLKHYDEAIVLFMPLPAESDLRIFSALAKVKGMDPQAIAGMEALLTRPIFAQASDMGTRYVDTAPASEGEGSFAYGLTGTVIRTKGDRARSINPADMAERRRGALSYTQVAVAGITKVNEIVMAYRNHESGLFPMYAAWDDNNKDFVELRADLTPTGRAISNTGRYGDS